MRATLEIDPSDAVPIWRQIEDGMRRLVASGSLQPGEPIPSVRELARELQVNPATVSKAYQRLTDAGLLVVHRGEGTYVADRTSEAMAGDRRRLLVKGARRYVDLAVTVRASRNEAAEALDSAWDEHEQRGRGGKA